ncbi:P-loop containing nucleoside triphosphate hydrolase protein [Xylariaceae sp. FL0662B]|nr:P-loop containing nucleoside triphosphate hydrolase protein [Xylariaceae sp. FL0662B]
MDGQSFEPKVDIQESNIDSTTNPSEVEMADHGPETTFGRFETELGALDQNHEMKNQTGEATIKPLKTKTDTDQTEKPQDIAKLREELKTAIKAEFVDLKEKVKEQQAEIVSKIARQTAKDIISLYAEKFPIPPEQTAKDIISLYAETTKLEDIAESSKPPSSRESIRSIDDTGKNERIQGLENELLRVQEELETWKTQFDEAQLARDSIENNFTEELEAERARSRELFDIIQNMKGNVRVMCRIRPPPSDTPDEDLVDFGPRERGTLSNTWGKVYMPSERKNVRGDTVTEFKPFEFERIFGPEESNGDVFDEIKTLVECSFHGQNVTIFCYGQTGSGKTYTMSHINPEDRTDDGIISKTLAMMFNAAEASGQFKYSFDISVVEIYLDNVYDLLQEPIEGQKVPVRLGQASFYPLETLAAADEIIEIATNSRVSSSTNKNATSSRSHLIMTFQVTSEALEGRNRGQVTQGLLNLVDLAGSERSASSGLAGKALDEGIKINQSLSSLNRAITALGEGKTVAYDTVLMKALRPAITPDCKVLMFVMISPLRENLITSIQTLEKGQEATNAKVASIKRNEKKSSTPSPSNKPKEPSYSTPARNPRNRPFPSTPHSPTASLSSIDTARTGIPPRGSINKSKPPQKNTRK